MGFGRVIYISVSDLGVEAIPIGRAEFWLALDGPPAAGTPSPSRVSRAGWTGGSGTVRGPSSFWGLLRRFVIPR